jgi:hypothetical protein
MAQDKGYFDAEIVPVRTKAVDKDGNEKTVIVSFLSQNVLGSIIIDLAVISNCGYDF